MTQTNKTFLVMAQYYTSKPEDSPFEGEYPRVMGFYQAATPEKAFELFLEEFAPDVRSAQVFYDQVTIVPCMSREGYQFKMSERFGELAKFPNPQVVREVGRK